MDLLFRLSTSLNQGDWYARFWNLEFFKRDCGHDYWLLICASLRPFCKAQSAASLLAWRVFRYCAGDIEIDINNMQRILAVEGRSFVEGDGFAEGLRMLHAKKPIRINP